MTIGQITFNISATGLKHTVTWDDLPLASQKRLAQASTRTMNDFVNGAVSAAKQAKDATAESVKEAAEAACLSWLEKLESGDWSARTGGGTRLSPVERQWRSLVEEMLVKLGVKRSDAENDAKDRDLALRTLAAMIAKRQDRGDVETVRDEIAKALDAEATRRANETEAFTL